MSAINREQLLARVTTSRDRLAVLSARTSNPELLRRISEADAIAAALDAECHRSAGVSTSLHDRVASLIRMVNHLTLDFTRDAVE